jgi:undecaprenyl-diphosphatase
MIAAAAGAFYFVLPQLANVSGSWRAFQSANWAWVPVIIVFSSLTYVGGGIALTGSVTQRLPFGPTVLTQVASSFVNRVSPANVGGMALNVRYLQRCGVDSSGAVAAVGLNSVAGAVVHVVLLVGFFASSGTALTHAFHLPSASKLLLALAVLTAIVGIVLATRRGRRTLLTPAIGGIRAAARDLRQLSGDPAKLSRLAGGSLGVTLAYIAALAAAVYAFDSTVSIAKIGAVYLASSVIAAAAPTPGGLGPLEAALVAGLTGIGMASGPAVSAVLTYRLATYWLPVLPGWLSWSLLQRWKYV